MNCGWLQIQLCHDCRHSICNDSISSICIKSSAVGSEAWGMSHQIFEQHCYEGLYLDLHICNGQAILSILHDEHRACTVSMPVPQGDMPQNWGKIRIHFVWDWQRHVWQDTCLPGRDLVCWICSVPPLSEPLLHQSPYTCHWPLSIPTHCSWKCCWASWVLSFPGKKPGISLATQTCCRQSQVLWRQLHLG